MKLSNEQLFGMYGAYNNSLIWDNSMFTICSFEGLRITKGEFSDVYIRTRTKQGTPNECTQERMKLILTPLSQIIDEDAIEVAKMCDNGFIGKKQTSVRRSHGKLSITTNECDDVGVVRINVPPALFGVEFIHEELSGFASGRLHQKTIDFLRSRGYDCGYAHISSLIEAGIAIDRTTLK